MPVTLSSDPKHSRDVQTMLGTLPCPWQELQECLDAPVQRVVCTSVPLYKPFALALAEAPHASRVHWVQVIFITLLCKGTDGRGGGKGQEGALTHPTKGMNM